MNIRGEQHHQHQAPCWLCVDQGLHVASVSTTALSVTACTGGVEASSSPHGADQHILSNTAALQASTAGTSGMLPCSVLHRAASGLVPERGGACSHHPEHQGCEVLPFRVAGVERMIWCRTRLGQQRNLSLCCNGCLLRHLAQASTLCHGP